MQEKKFESRKQEYLYQLLDRLRTDCEYYLGNGNHHPQALWAGNEQGQIDKMREIWNQLEEKPEWLTWEDINEYAAKMGVEDLPSTKDGTAEKEIQDMLDKNYEKEKKVGLEEADISTNSTGENLEKEKEDLKQQLNDIEEIETMKKKLDNKMDDLFEEGKEIKSNNRLLTFKLYDSGYREYNGGQISSDKEIITINDLKRNINYNWKKLNSNSNKEKVTILKNELTENIKTLINTIEIKIANIEKSRDTGSPKDREVIENRLYSLDIAKDNCLEALEKITNKINVKQEESKEIKIEDQYESERRRGVPPLDRIAEMEYYDNEKWYKEHIKDYLDITDFVNKNIAEISSEYNLKDTKAEEVCKKVYKLALGLDKKEELDDKVDELFEAKSLSEFTNGFNFYAFANYIKNEITKFCPSAKFDLKLSSENGLHVNLNPISREHFEDDYTSTFYVNAWINTNKDGSYDIEHSAIEVSIPNYSHYTDDDFNIIENRWTGNSWTAQFNIDDIDKALEMIEFICTHYKKDETDELLEESKNIKEIKTAREVFNDSIADNSWFNSWVKNAKIVMETDNYILAVYKSKENIRLGVVSSQNPFSSAINIEITDNFKGKCVKATVNWSAVGSRSADETLEFAKLLKEAGDFCKQIEGEDFSNKLLEENKKIKMESQVSNYTFEQIGSCLKDKGNDFKIQVQGSETKTNWLNIDKEDLQKIYNTLSYKKKKTESLNTTIDLFEQANDLYNSNAISAWQLFLIGQMVEYIDYNIENSNITIDDLVRLSEEFNIEDSDILSIINNFILENIASKFDKLDESICDNLDLEPGSEEEAQYNELNDRNLKDEFNALSEEERQAYLDLVPENLGPVSVNLLNKIAEQDGLDKDILYWVVNIRGGKVEEKKDPEEGFEVNEDLAWQCDSILYKNILTTYIEDTNTLLFTKYKGEDASYNDSDDIDTIVYRNQTPEEIKKYIDTNLISNKLNESIDNIIKEEQEEINKINDEIESLKHLQQAYRGENENYVQELQDEIDALLADKEILEQELEEDKKQLIEAKDASKFPSSDGTKMKLSNYDFEEAYKTVANFRDLFNKEQKEWLIAHHITMNELYNGLKDLLSTFKVSIFKDIISIDDYIKELDKTESLNESTSTDLYNKIKNEPRSDKYEKGLKLRDEIVNAWKNNDLETADNKWEELYRLFSSPIEDLDSSVTEEQTLRNNIELNEILSTIEDQCVYDVTDYGREKDYKKMGF